jgi:hypothetical protein
VGRKQLSIGAERTQTSLHKHRSSAIVGGGLTPAPCTPVTGQSVSAMARPLVKVGTLVGLPAAMLGIDWVFS